MKVTINQNIQIKETEVIINCTCLDDRVRNLVSFIQQYSTSLEGIIDETVYYVPLDSILYIDYVDRKTFFYDSHRIFGCQCTMEPQQIHNSGINLYVMECTVPQKASIEHFYGD